MITYNDVNLKLKSSDWPADVKQSAEAILPRLGKWSLSYISQYMTSIASEFGANKIVNILSLQPVWYDLIQKKQFQEIINTTKNIIESDEPNSHKALLAIILDIRLNKTLSEFLTPEISKLFDSVEILYLESVPTGEVVNLINSRIDSFSEFSNLEMEIKRYCYYRDILQKDDFEIEAFIKAITTNNQLIGTPLKAVKDWIQDFQETEALSSNHSAYDIAHFITNSPSANNLSPKEKDLVSEILQTYNWLYQPNTTESEIEEYERHRFNIEQKPPAPAPEPRAIIAPTPGKLSEFDAARATPSATLHENKGTGKPTPAPTPALAPATAIQEQPQNPYAHSANVPNQYSTNQAKIHDLINRKPKAGVIMDPTNIHIDDEKKRLEKNRTNQTDEIQLKLAELRNRNKSQK